MRRLDLEGDLRRAIEERSLEVAYQPIVQAATGRIVGFEASCRWPTGEPAEFLAMADETGLSEDITLRAAKKRDIALVPISQDVIDSEQEMADTFAENDLLPGKFDVAPFFSDEFNSDTTGK